MAEADSTPTAVRDLFTGARLNPSAPLELPPRRAVNTLLVGATSLAARMPESSWAKIKRL
jgi:hypothetical protein